MGSRGAALAARHRRNVVLLVRFGAVGLTGVLVNMLTLIALRSRTPQGTLALSAFAQSAGYLIASAGPVLFGVIHDWTGGWTWSLIAICGVLVVHLFCGLAVSRRRFVEDELGR